MGLEEQELREWVRRVATGQASRRQFLRTMLGLGLSGPMIADLLAASTPVAAQGTREAPQAFTPTRRGGGGKLRLLFWEAPEMLNKHLTVGSKDIEAARVVYEPLLSVNPEGDFVPILAAEIPSVENGGRAPDGIWTIWRLKQGVVWHDGQSFTADDVMFTWEYVTDPATAAALAVDRRTIFELTATGQLTSNVLNTPTPFQSPHTRWEFNLDKAAHLLEQAGWKRGSDGVRVKDGRRMQVVYQASANLRNQKAQAIVRQALERLGVEVELKAINADVFFSSDPGNPDTNSHFYADMQMHSDGNRLDPQRYMGQFVSWEIAQKANNWAGRNFMRWANAAYDQLWQQARTELDPIKRAALFIRMNDLLIEDVVVIPMVWRHWVSAVSHRLRGLELGPWDRHLWNLAYWYRET